MKSRISKLQDHRFFWQRTNSQCSFLTANYRWIFCSSETMATAGKGDKQKTQKTEKNGSRATTAPGQRFFFLQSCVTYGGMQTSVVWKDHQENGSEIGESQGIEAENTKGQKNVHGRIDANMWMLNQELNIPYYNIHDTINWFINTYTVHNIYMPVIVMIYVREMVFDHIFGYEIAKFAVEKTACNLVNKYFERQPSIFLSLVVHEMTRGIKGAPRHPCSKEEGCHLSEQSTYIWIHYYTVSLL